MESIRTLGEKKNYKYLGIFEVNNIKQAEMIEKLRKSTSEEQEHISIPSSVAEISSKK